MRQKFFAGIVILAVTLIIFTGSAWPDFGSFSGTSDYGSSSRGGSSSGSGRSGGSYSSSSSRGNSTNFNITPLAGGVATGALLDEENNLSAVVGAIFVIFLVFMWLKSKNKSREQRNFIPINFEPVRDLKPMSTYITLDPEFDEGRIKSLIANLYVQMQETWHAKDISSLRPYMTDEFYNQMNRQLDALRITGRTDYTENIAVLVVDLKGWRQSGGMDYIIVSLTSRITSYVLNDRTGELISGDKNKEKFMEYEIELSRKTGTVTAPEGSEEPHTATCPHCGAPIDINASARCEYCGSVITQVNTDWAVCSMKGISQRTIE
ncbi:MAG: zinc-ribbon domain-containing transport protein [Synergistaceae bacterium]|nr:zinc-ribbon domain-containing transport protein [Synergistaceae bacterium]